MAAPTVTEIRTALEGLKASEIAPLGMNLDMIAALLSLLLQSNTGGSGGGTVGGATETTLLAVRDRLPNNLVSGKLSVDGSGVTQPVSGSVSVANFPVTQPVSLATLPVLATGNNVIGSIANTTFASTQSGTWNINNISGSIGLPTGAATSAKQPSLGVAGTPSTDVLSIQGVVGGTALTINNSLAPASSVSGSKVIAGVNTFEPLRTTISLKSGIWVQAGLNNTGLVTVKTTGAIDGLVLEKKDSFFFVIDDPSKLEIAVSVANEMVRWWGS